MPSGMKDQVMWKKLRALLAPVPGTRPAGLGRKSARLTVELLEARITPASMFSYSDGDGDQVTVTSSRGELAGKFVLATLGVGNELAMLDLTDPIFQGADITVSVVRAGGGDGLTSVGGIKAAGNDLGEVVIKGDLGDIDCGDADTTTAAIKLLKVRSMGRFGVVTQEGLGELTSDINGALGALKVAGDIKDAFIRVNAGSPADGKIGSVSIGGSLVGGSRTDSGAIRSTGDIGAGRIGRDLQGGSGVNSGRILTDGKIASLTIGGSVLGGSQSNSGQVSCSGNLGPVAIGHDLQGGPGGGSGFIGTSGKLAGLTIGGS